MSLTFSSILNVYHGKDGLFIVGETEALEVNLSEERIKHYRFLQWLWCLVYLVNRLVALYPLFGFIHLTLCLLFLYQSNHSKGHGLFFLKQNYAKLDVKTRGGVPQGSIIRPLTISSIS